MKNLNKNLEVRQMNQDPLVIYEKRIVIEKSELEKIKNQLDYMGISLSKLRKEIGMSFERLYNGITRTMNENRFNKLESIIGYKVPHKIELGSIKKINLNENEDLAELTCILLGDGGLYTHRHLKKHELKVTLNRVDEQPYVHYVNKLFYEQFQCFLHIHPRKKGKTVDLRIGQRSIIDFFKSKGLLTGNKVENQINVPNWIKNNNYFLKRGIKGLIDTDGSIWVNSQTKSIHLGFRNASLPLVRDFKEMCESLKIKPQPKIGEVHKINKKSGKVHTGYQVKISSKYYVNRFLDIINPEKWKDQNRRSYIGNKLIILNSRNEIKEKIFKQVEIDFPKKSDRRYSVKFGKYFKKISIENGCNVNFRSIEQAIKEAFDYKK